MMSRSFLSPYFGLTVTLVEVSPGARTFVAHRCISLWIPISLSIYYCRWVVFILWYSQTFTPALWRLLVMSLTVVFGFLFTVRPLFLSSTAAVRHLVVIFLVHDIPNYCIGYAQCLCNGSDRFSLFSICQKVLHFSSLRQLSGLHVDLSFIKTNAVVTNETND